MLYESIILAEALGIEPRPLELESKALTATLYLDTYLGVVVCFITLSCSFKGISQGSTHFLGTTKIISFLLSINIISYFFIKVKKECFMCQFVFQKLAPAGGFEPPRRSSRPCGFQDRPLQPLGYAGILG